ncbi:MAG: hypothetical protein VYE18_03060 [Pseudomonadota bacterium]|nr:hypothetical protein [Pseudomonadota bacterium]
MFGQSLGLTGIAMAAAALALPLTPRGWLAFSGVGAFYSISIIGIFVAMSKIGAVRVGLLTNCEPLSSDILGVMLLDQFLSPLQFLGVAVVLATITFAATGKGKRREDKVSPAGGSGEAAPQVLPIRTGIGPLPTAFGM